MVTLSNNRERFSVQSPFIELLCYDTILCFHLNKIWKIYAIFYYSEIMQQNITMRFCCLLQELT